MSGRGSVKAHHDARLRHGIVGLTDVAVQTGRRADVDDRTIASLRYVLDTHVGRRFSDDAEGSGVVYFEHESEEIVAKRMQHLVGGEASL